MTLSSKLIKAACAALIASALALPALAQDKKTDDQGHISRITVEVSNEVFSPFCPGKTLAMCTSPNAAKVRRDIQEMATKGQNKEEIKQEIIATYGEEFRLTEPPATDNFGLLIGIGIALLIALGLIFTLSRNKSAGSKGPSVREDDEDKEELSDEERAYLDELRSELDDGSSDDRD